MLCVATPYCNSYYVHGCGADVTAIAVASDYWLRCHRCMQDSYILIAIAIASAYWCVCHMVFYDTGCNSLQQQLLQLPIGSGMIVACVQGSHQ